MVIIMTKTEKELTDLGWNISTERILRKGNKVAILYVANLYEIKFCDTSIVKLAKYINGFSQVDYLTNN